VPEVLILSGPPGAGKSTVAQALSERYDRVAHIDVDTLRHFITPTGYVAPGKPGFERQRALATRNACSLACNFLAERFAVIIDDVVVTADELDDYLRNLEGAGIRVHFVRLLPSLEVCEERNRNRREGRQPAERIRKLHADFVAATDLPGATVDSSDLTAYATADKLQALTTSGESLVLQPHGAS
jgi:chloramphenicol 3-O-phosphotransferase